jgi:hypothetical protein
MPQSQSHGFILAEYPIREKVFGIPPESNNTDTHDIPCEKNKFDPNENISIKATGGLYIDCGDILRFFNYDMKKKNTIICVKYVQTLDKKMIKKIYEINYNQEMHRYLFGTITIEELTEYVNFVKNIKSGKCDKETRKKYISEKKRLQKYHNMKINISPKVDSKSQRRVQCSIPNFNESLKNYITYYSSDNKPNVIRDIEIPLSIISKSRTRNSKLS